MIIGRSDPNPAATNDVRRGYVLDRRPQLLTTAQEDRHHGRGRGVLRPGHVGDKVVLAEVSGEPPLYRTQVPALLLVAGIHEFLAVGRAVLAKRVQQPGPPDQAGEAGPAVGQCSARGTAAADRPEERIRGESGVATTRTHLALRQPGQRVLHLDRTADAASFPPEAGHPT